ncbi:MAG: penicillin-binding protein activator LpoB, partial [Spirochaetales bacterium]|nr:penicillin-binding protein activator LpoB [Spirochaetales bacterium]
MKRSLLAFVTAIVFLSCASTDAPETEAAQAGLTLDAAIADIASYFIERLPQASLTAIVAFEAPSAGLSDYVFGELWNRFEASGRFVMIDRRNLERIRAEILYQMSGEVSDESARSIGKQYGPQTIVYG